MQRRPCSQERLTGRYRRFAIAIIVRHKPALKATLIFTKYFEALQ